jgi:3'-phosphoadenosine 5'-phosphosulfate sulfotransferase (PAPS reductase)/FAD synthetase
VPGIGERSLMPTKTDQVYEIARPAHLNLTPEQVGQLTKPEREARVRELMAESRRLYEAAIEELIVKPGKAYVGTALLFSGGNDSTVLAHLFRPMLDLAIHANTGIGIGRTRQFVRWVCESWGLPLIERHPPTSYRELVLERGFPGPGQHFKMYQRLKERAFLAVRAELIEHTHRERVIYLAGRRRDESERRAGTEDDPGIPLWEREGSLLWVSPMAYWTKLDLNTYRLMAMADDSPVPLNAVTAVIHMSGECLCGSFAKRGELDEIGAWFRAAAAEIRALDPFGGTGTTALVAKALGRHGVSVDMSADYCRLAEWRVNDPKQSRARAEHAAVRHPDACEKADPRARGPPTDSGPGLPESVAVAAS